ncbi:hypothetical protein A1O7_06483 [Cladophialophora yegresii CBS 114405]|uniref:Uncharacterized protein n=1 Tax=Cladophialophora yegresii CBS 114405 TaxID=1182544 RepID=W9VTI2_9EURO|nr:uncharacterized protein A1O7_06483 [Cladophialophora yegresii CBS 114405]EXJ59052.1 hypothetical protein A1O7_06483 [Cladophialophora yegresii CBS 114405]
MDQAVTNPSSLNKTISEVEFRKGWVHQPNQRGTIDIIWSCLLVLFVCIWTVINLNVPARKDGYWTQVFRKVRWSTLAICAPEILSLFASMQWNGSLQSVREMHEMGDKDWSAVHAFFANSGGFMLESTDQPEFPVRAASIHYLRVNGWIKPPKITKEEIWDRSKADKFAKGVALTQTAWLLLQCLARVVKGLAVSPLEIFTLAFVVCTACTAYFWLNKPQNVQLPTTIHMDHAIADVLLAAGDAAKDPYIDTPMDFVERPLWEQWERRPSLLAFGGLDHRPLPREPDDYAQPPPKPTLALCMWSLSMVHAGVHVLGWHFPFATTFERILWRVCSLVMLGVMCLGGVIPVISTRPNFDFRINLLWIWIRQTQNHRSTIARRWLFDLPVHIAASLYILARMFIIFEVFYSLRSLPASSYTCVDWTAIWPHV